MAHFLEVHGQRQGSEILLAEVIVFPFLKVSFNIVTDLRHDFWKDVVRIQLLTEAVHNLCRVEWRNAVRYDNHRSISKLAFRLDSFFDGNVLQPSISGRVVRAKGSHLVAMFFE